MDLTNKKILFIGPKFFNYEQEIKNEMESLGAEVDFIAEKEEKLTYRIAKNFSISLLKKINASYLNSILKQVNRDYDYFFLIKGEIITLEFLEALKLKIPNAKFIMYQWDSIKNNPNYLKIMLMFDKVMTFDMVDAKKLNIGYLPLFYTPIYQNLKLNDNRKYDILFFGSYHGDRLEIIKKLDQECERLGLSFKYHLYIQKLALLKRFLLLDIKFEDLQYLSTKSVQTDEILQSYKVTKTVLDIESPEQNGLTMRTFEVLGSGLKLITTNINILSENFYDRSVITIYSRGNKIFLERSFINQEANKLKLINQYCLNSWIKNVFNANSNNKCNF